MSGSRQNLTRHRRRSSTGSTVLAEMVFLWQLKERVLKPVKGVETALWIALLSLATLAAGTAIEALGDDLIDVLVALVAVDGIALTFGVWSVIKGAKISGRGANLVKGWYPLLYPMMIAFEAISVASSALKLITDVDKLADEV